MRSRELGLVIALLAFALFIIGATSAYATHTPVANASNQKVLGAMRLKVDLLSLDAQGNPTSTVLASTTQLRLPTSIASNLNFTNLAYAVPCTKVSNVVECLFGGISINVPGGGTVQINNLSATALAKIIATKGDTSNNLKLVNFKVQNLSLPKKIVAVRLAAEFNFPSSSAGRGHGYSCKTTLQPFVSGTTDSSTAKDRVLCTGEFSYIDSGLVNFSTPEFIGGGPGQSLTVDYTPSGAIGSNVMSNKCVLEGNSTITTAGTCPAPTQLTACASNLGSCPVENILISQTYKLAIDQRAEIGAGIQGASGEQSTEEGQPGGTCQMVADLNSEGRLFCAIAQQNFLFNPQDHGCFQVIFFGSADLNYQPGGNCDPDTIRAGIGGFELGGPPQSVNCSLDFNNDGFNDCRASFCPANQVGLDCGPTEAILQGTVSCNMTETCQESFIQGNKVKLLPASTGVFPEQLNCTIDIDVSPCNNP